MMKKAVIFDLDGTLLYTLDSMAKPGNRVLKELGLSEQPVDAFRFYCGEGAAMLTRRMLADAGNPDLSLYDQAYELYMRYFAADPLYGVKPFEGIEDLLFQLKHWQVKVAVCSNKPEPATRKVITTLFPDVFDTIVGQSEKLRRKPAPDMPLEAASLLGVAPCECLYCGDSGTDMQTAQAAGMTGIGVLWGYRSREELLENGARHLIASPQELLPLLSSDGQAQAE